MAKAKSPALRSVVTDDEFGGFRITIPAPQGCAYALGCVSLCCAGVVALLFLFILSDPRENFEEAGPLLAFWLLFGLALGVCLLFSGLREVAIIEGKTLVLRSETIIGFARETAFELASLRNLRIQCYPEQLGQPCAIAFEHGARTHFFGRGLDRDEAARLVKTIRTKFPIRNDWDDAEPLPVNL
jgi:hypothetical protein